MGKGTPVTQRILAVGIDPAKRTHHAVAVLYPDRVVLDEAIPNEPNEPSAFAHVDDKVAHLAHQYRARIIYDVEDHRRYGQALVEVLVELAGGKTGPVRRHRRREQLQQRAAKILTATADL